MSSTKTIRSKFIFSILAALVLSLGVVFISSASNPVHASSVANEQSIFAFTVTGEDECNVRLLDKTVTRAITAHTYDTLSKLRSNAYTLDGWRFTGWKDAEGNFYTDGQYVSTASKGGTVTLFAQWV